MQARDIAMHCENGRKLFLRAQRLASRAPGSFALSAPAAVIHAGTQHKLIRFMGGCGPRRVRAPTRPFVGPPQRREVASPSRTTPMIPFEPEALCKRV